MCEKLHLIAIFHLIFEKEFLASKIKLFPENYIFHVVLNVQKKILFQIKISGHFII